MVFGSFPATPVRAYAEATSSSWTVNSDGTLSLSDTAAAAAVGDMTQSRLVMVGTENGKIVGMPSGSGVTTRVSGDQDAALILFSTNLDAAQVRAAISGMKFTNSTTSVNVAVTYGNTTIPIDSGDVAFGVLNAHGEAHA